MTFTATPEPANIPPRMGLGLDTSDPTKSYTSVGADRYRAGMTQGTASGPGPGWYETEDGRERWWDGSSWGEQFRSPEAVVAAPTTIEASPDALNDAVAIMVAAGGVIESRSATQATVIFGKKANHVLHAILSIFTLGLWLLAWLVVAQGNSQTRVLLTVDAEGEIVQENIPIK